MIVGTIKEHRKDNDWRVTTLHLFGDSTIGMRHAEMREHTCWVGYAPNGTGELKLRTRLTHVRGERVVGTCNEESHT